jgi:glycosyltransferase involved in cell wall biosynthesis
VLYLTNSNYTKLEVKKLLNKNSVVIYPPVEVGKILKESANADNRERQNIVITISRISYEKNLEVIPLIAYYAKSLGLQVKFVIAGAVKGSRGLDVLRRIQKISKKLNVEEFLLILPNISEERKIMMLCKSKVYIHPMKNEHFGITVVEAMAAGVPVIVYRSGGPYLDIIDRDKYGLSFENAKEAAELIYYLLMNNVLWEFYHKSAIARSLLFSEDAFEKRIRFLIKRYLKEKV